VGSIEGSMVGLILCKILVVVIVVVVGWAFHIDFKNRQ